MIAVPPLVSKSEYWLSLRSPLRKNGESCITVGSVTRTAGVQLAYSRLKALAVNEAGYPADVGRILAQVQLKSILASSKRCKGDKLPRNGP